MTNAKLSAAERETKFLTWWKEKRKYKTRFIIGSGLFWGLLTVVGSQLLINRFDFSRLDANEFGIGVVVFTTAGLLLAYGFCRLQEKRFKQLSSLAD